MSVSTKMFFSKFMSVGKLISSLNKIAGAIVLSTLLVLLSCPGVFAGTINYVADPTGGPASVTGKIELTKIGSISLNRGRAIFSGNTVEVTVIPEWMFDRESVFSGYLLHTSTTQKGNELLVNGLAYFDSGDWLSYIDDPKREDVIMTGTGEVRGKIVSVTPFALEMDTSVGTPSATPSGSSGTPPGKTSSNTIQTIRLADITDVDSPRVYHFLLPALLSAAPGHRTTNLQSLQQSPQQFEGQSLRLSLSPTTRVFRLAALKKDVASQGDGDISTGKLVLIGTLLATVNMAQSLPEIFMLARQPHWSRLAQSKQFETLTNSFFAPQFPVPVPLPRGVAF